jgi:nucleoid DNA-binding protein
MYQKPITKHELALIIQSKLNNEFSHEKIMKMINFIVLWMRNQLLSGKIIKINGFGTLNIFRYTIKEFYDIYSEKIVPKKIKKSIRFDATAYLRQLLHNKKDKFI